jgi:hypothetical protein
VVDDLGAPISGAIVHFHNAPATQKDAVGRVHLAEPFVSSHALTAKDGTFSVTGIPPGHYSLYAAGVSPTHLRTCDWGQRSTHIDLTTATSATGVKFQVPSGVLVTFLVTDARNQIQDFPTAVAPTGNGPPPGNFRIFVRDGATFFMAGANPVLTTGAVRQYAVAVPKTADLRLLLDTRLAVTDQSHATLPVRALSSAISIKGLPVTVPLNVP